METTSTNIDIISNFHKIAIVNIPVPFRKPGNVVEHLSIDFEVYENGHNFKAVPLCNEASKLLTALPEYFYFRIVNGRTIVLERKYKEIAENIVAGLLIRKSLGAAY